MLMPKPSDDECIGKRIRSIRLHQNLSQGVVSKRAGILSSYLSRIETERVHPTVRTVRRIAKALKVSLDDMLGPSPPKRYGKPCPITGTGHCLMDLIDTSTVPRLKRKGGNFTQRQIYLLRRLTLLVEKSRPSLQKALEMLVEEMLTEPQQARNK